MKILYEKQLSKNHPLLLDSPLSPSKLNIKLKTSSLTCLDIPLDTCVGFKKLSTIRKNDQRTIVGSVDLISEIQQQPNNENLSRISSSKPLINIVSNNKQLPKVQQEWRQILKHRFRGSSSYIQPTSLYDSVLRLRRTRHIQNIHQSSLQAINKITTRKHRRSLTRNESIPKFTFRDLPSISTNQYEQSYKTRLSPFTSLPEIRSFVEQNCSDNFKSIKPPSITTSSSSSLWKKSGSWSWKSSDAFQLNSTQNKSIQSNLSTKNTQHELSFSNYSNLPVIIESPLRQRPSLQITKSHNNYIQQKPHRLYQKKNSIPHSISNYEVSSNRFSFQPTTRYPSTPHLAQSRQKYIDQFDYHPFQLNLSPIATFDDDDSISSTSSFRSCLNSINDLSANNISESSSSEEEELEDRFQDSSTNYDLNTGYVNEPIKQTRLSTRHFCIIQ